MEHSGEWFFEREEFVKWRNMPTSSLLWLRGDGTKPNSSAFAVKADVCLHDSQQVQARAISRKLLLLSYFRLHLFVLK